MLFHLQHHPEADARVPLRRHADAPRRRAALRRRAGPAAAADQQGGLVTFTPGARSAWHTHPAGQLLIVTSGTGWVQEEGGAKHEIKPGDVIWTPPGVKHWHGATATNSMSHIAITNVVNGKNVEWLEKVSAEQYQK